VQGDVVNLPVDALDGDGDAVTKLVGE